MEPDHPFVIARLAGVFLCALPAVRELYQYVNDPRYVHSLVFWPFRRFAAPRAAPFVSDELTVVLCQL